MRSGAVAIAMCALLVSCGNPAVQINDPMAVEQRGAPVKMPPPVDRMMHGFSVHLDQTVVLWARQAHVPLVNVVDATLGKVDAALASPPSVVGIEAGTYGVIPGVGIGGTTDPYTGRVQVNMDSRTPLGLKELLTTWVPLSLAHELDHAKRVIDGPGYGRTFGEAMVSEGVAEAFVHELYPHRPAVPWTERLDDPARTWTLAKPLLNEPDDDPVRHDRWFYGKDGLPRFAAYRLGYAIAESYLAGHKNRAAADLALVPAKEILRGFAIVSP